MPVPKLAFPKRHKHTDIRSREYLTPAEVNRLRKAARSVRRHGLRNDTMILLAYRHGLRVSELINLRWDQFDLDQGFFHVRRVKNGVPSTHPLTGSEIRALRKLKRLAGESVYVFLSEHKGPLTDSSVRKMMAQAGASALSWGSPCTRISSGMGVGTNSRMTSRIHGRSSCFWGIATSSIQ